MVAVYLSGAARVARQKFLLAFGESPSGKAPDFDSGIRRFDPYLPSQFFAESGRGRGDGYCNIEKGDTAWRMTV